MTKTRGDKEVESEKKKSALRSGYKSSESAPMEIVDEVESMETLSPTPKRTVRKAEGKKVVTHEVKVGFPFLFLSLSLLKLFSFVVLKLWVIRYWES